MSIPRETPIIDPSQPQPGSGAPVTYPSEVVDSTRSTTPPQQGNTQPGSGSTMHTHAEDQKPGDIAREGVNVVTVPAEGQSQEIPFKERVIGIAQKTRGTLLGKPELKEQGEQILQGNVSARPHD
ncbi:hypothetical protein BDP27DRAFT_1452236 [Rhodocollybia butyracea]|uniref:Uncharacterized protein n=1 Tax=Rhodocollybia butyracea TaxID=206335 RepID=A0A9P5U031_9AGAR|nr:hypothetical protein BDP27DRAFT_1452236 [Rhodocollybia butyracea]